MFKIICREMTGENCDFVAEGNTKEEAKNIFYAHGAESPLHKERYRSATEEDKAEFGKQLDTYLEKQG